MRFVYFLKFLLKKMNSLFTHFSNPIIFGITIAICMAILVYLNKKITKEEIKKSSIYKIVFSSGLLSGGLMYLANGNKMSKIKLGGNALHKEISTDNPDDWD